MRRFMSQPRQNTRRARAGFSLIELLLVFLLLSVVLVAVFSQINLVQQRARAWQAANPDTPYGRP